MRLLPPLSRLWSISLFTFFVLTCAVSLHSDEWKARHALVAPNGTMTLTIPPSPSEVFLPGPADPSDPTWLDGMKAWRKERRTQLRLDESDYINPDLAWARRAFSQVQLLVWDRSIYDPETRQYTPEKFLAETESRIGPIDSVLLWHVYPNLGVDDRNQFDLMRDLPGGLSALKQLVADFHRHNVKVLFPVLAWDSGTRQESAPPWTTLTQLLKGNRRRRHQLRHPGKRSRGFSRRFGCLGTSPRLRATIRNPRRIARLEHSWLERLGHMGRRRLSGDAHGQQNALARTPPHDRRHGPFHAR